MTDPDLGPWEVGVCIILSMFGAIGMIVGGILGHPLIGMACGVGVYLAIVGCGITYEHFKRLT